MKPLVKTTLRTTKITLLKARRWIARRAVSALHRSARRRRFENPVLLRVMLAVYFLKRTAQETFVRGWPLRRCATSEMRCSN